MKKYFKNAFYIITLVMPISVLLTGCVFVNTGNGMNRSSSVQAQGSRENYEIKVSAFNKIKIEGNCEIQYNYGNSDTVTLMVQPNIREYIVVETVNGELIFRTTSRISYGLSKSPVLTVYAPALNSVTIEGAGIFTANDKITSDSLTLNISGAGSGTAELDVNTFNVIISGAGNFNSSGKANNSVITLSGAGNYNGLSLLTADTTVNLTGAGSVKVYSTGVLRIDADGAGSVEYKGSPSLQLNTSGLIGIKNLN